MPNTTILTETRPALRAMLADARAATDALFSILTPDALYERPIPERHRLIFYLGHLEAFDWNLIRQVFSLESRRPDFDKLFAFGIDPIGGGLPNEPASDWPPESAVRSYNEEVRGRIDEALRGGRDPLAGNGLEEILHMAIEHRLMHGETLAYLFHQLPYEAKRAPKGAAPAPPAKGTWSARIEGVPAGRATLGRSRARGGFGWDNEFEEHRADVSAFSIDAHKVSNGRFLEFVRDGGYRDPRHWSPASWEWKTHERIRHPHFWRERDGAWFYHGMFAETPLPLDAPVYVSHAEASAFARWAHGTLPTEEQFHRAAYGTPRGQEREYPWGSEAPSARHGNFDMRFWDPTPLGSFPEGDSAFGISELVGNGWEWTSSVFKPFEGFRPHPLYEGYSANFFDGHHFVQKGGSPRTASCMLRRSFRNWFQPHYAYVYAGFRIVHP